MRKTDWIRYSLRNIWRGKGRTLLSILAVAIGVFAIVTTSVAGESGKEMILQKVKQLGLRGLTVYTTEESGQRLSLEDVALASAVKGVSQAMPVLLEYGNFSTSKLNGNAVFWGVTEQLEEVMDLRLLKGRLFSKEDMVDQSSVIVVDDTIVNTAFGGRNVLGKTITLELQTEKETFTIVGVVSSQKAGIEQLINGDLPQFFYLPYDTLAELTGRSEFDQLAISCMNESETEKTGASVVKRLNRSAGLENAYRYQNIDAYKDNLEDMTEAIVLLIGAIAAISLLVAGISIMNSMLSAASEREQEIGICMAIGAQQHDILSCFLLEAAIISVLGGILGLAGSIGCAYFVGSVLGIEIIFPWNAVVLAECAAISFGTLFGLLPARKAANLDPIHALRS